jgi:hypothetical protein
VRKYLNGQSPYREGASKQDIIAAAAEALKQMSSSDSRGWDELRILKKHWDGPIVLKGIQDLEDAKWDYIFGSPARLASSSYFWAEWLQTVVSRASSLAMWVGATQVTRVQLADRRRISLDQHGGRQVDG